MGEHQLNILQRVLECGAALRVENGELQGRNLDKLPPGLLDDLIKNKLSIIREICRLKMKRGDATAEYVQSRPPPGPPPCGQKRRRVNPIDKKNFRIAKSWIIPRYQQLISLGWSAKRLFGASRHPIPFGGWGAAWLPGWSEASDIELGNDGVIAFVLQEPLRVVRQTTRP